MVLHSGVFPHLKAILDDFIHHGPDDCTNSIVRAPAGSACRSNITDASNSVFSLQDIAQTRHCRSKAASFLGFLETDQEQGILHRPVIKTSFSPNCWFKPPHRCKYQDECGVVDNCSQCGNSDRQCNSDDCTMWEGQCRARDVGEGFKMGQWYYYAGPSRPFRATGDTTRYGARVQVIGPGKDKPRAQMTEADKSPDTEANKKTWKLVYFPGNLRYVKVKTLSHEQPKLPEPPSKEARVARADALYHLKPAGSMLGMLSPCDPKGRILSTPDGTFCGDHQACVSALPQDFAKHSGKFCWHWFVPDCPEVKCPDKPYCPPPPKCSPEGKCPPYACPVAAPCPKQQQCEPGYWKDMCRKNAGQPWCVPPDLIKQYGKPIEIKCSASGKDIRDKPGSGDGCWWLRKVAKHSGKMDFQRLAFPGMIKRPYAPASGPFVTGREWGDKGAMTEKQAEKWIQSGEFSGMRVENSEFLAKKKPPPPSGVIGQLTNAVSAVFS